MGWAEKLPSGRYRAMYRDADGKVRNATPGVTHTHKKAAEREADSAELEARKSTWRNPDRGLMSWGEWCDKHWWPNRSVEASTFRNDGYRKNKYLIPRWGDI